MATPCRCDYWAQLTNLVGGRYPQTMVPAKPEQGGQEQESSLE